VADSEPFWSFGSEVPEQAPPLAQTPPRWQPGERVGGRYLIEECLGRGAHATVYRAWDPHLNRRVALKLLGSLEAKAQARLLREAELLARLRHPALLQVHDLLTHDGHLVLVLELVDGPSLEETLNDLDRERGLRLLEQVAQGLGEAHRQGIVHRDVKPANVLLADDGPRLADFGLARATQASTLTQSGALVGTPLYMAPEQLEGRHAVGPRADVWALGVILFRLLSGELPFRAPNMVAQAQLVQRGPPRLAARGVEVPAELEAVCARAMATDPALRFPDAAAFAGALALARAATTRAAVGPGPAPAWGVAGVLLAAAIGVGVALGERRSPPRLGQAARSPRPPSDADRDPDDARERPLTTRWDASEALLREGRPRAAVELLDRILATHPELPEGWVRRGLALAADRDRRAAEASFGRALALNPKHVEALECRAAVRWELGLRELAEEDRSALRRITAERPAAWAALARSHRAFGDADEALAACDRAIALGLDEAFLHAERALHRYRRSERRQAEADLLEAARLPSSEAALAWLNLGSRFYDVGETAAALQVLERGLTLDERFPDAQVLRGLCLEQLGRSGDAAYERALALGVEAYRLGYFRGRFRLSRGDTAGAVRDLEMAWAGANTGGRDEALPWLLRARAELAGELEDAQASVQLWQASLEARRAKDRARSVELLGALLELQPDLAEVWYRRGYARLQLQENPAAAADLSRALELEPDHTGALWARKQALSRLGREDEATRDLRRLAEVTPEDPEVWRSLSHRAWRAGNAQESLRLADRAVEVGGEFVDYSNRALVRFGLNDPEGARADTFRALELEESVSVEKRLNLAPALALLHEFELALGLAERILEADEHPDALWLRAHARSELGRPGAEADLERVLELAPEHPKALYLRGCIRLAEGRLAEAIADLERVQGDPREAEAAAVKLAEARRRLAAD
jgi:serine/threonine protein kinase